MTPTQDFPRAVGAAADFLQSRIAAGVPPRETRRQHLAASGFRFWTPGTSDDAIRADFVAGGYTAEKAGFDFPRVLRAVSALLRGEIEGLVLTGRTGCGKTTAARVIQKHVRSVIRPDSPYFEGDTPFVTDADACNCAHENLGIVVSHSPAIQFFLDDLGADRPRMEYGNASDPVGDYIIRWGDARKRGILLVTTNLDAEGIRRRYDDRVLSRLVQRCGWLAMEAPDHRLENLRKF